MYAMLGQITFEMTDSFTALTTTHNAKFLSITKSYRASHAHKAWATP